MILFSVIKTAFSSIWRNKLASVLAILGVVIGVASVSILISVGQGLKNDISNLIQGLGTNVMVVLSGKVDMQNINSNQQVNPANFIATDILTLDDVHTIEGLEKIESVSPLSLVAGQVQYNDKKVSPTITGVYSTVLNAMEIIKVDKGQMFGSNNEDSAVLGSKAVEGLFGDENPVGKEITIGKTKQLKVIGTLAQSKSSSSITSEIDSMVMIPFDIATDINKGKVQISRVIIKASDDADVEIAKKDVEQHLLDNHKGEENFTVMTQEDVLDLFSQFMNMATAMVSAIAAISIIVGGIGIMNIMLVSVTERTREIGIRKAVGATNFAILIQFLTEAITITVLGGVIGIGLTFVAAQIIEKKASLHPAVTTDVILLALGISFVVGIIFGLLPALRASRKNPIEALRYE